MTRSLFLVGPALACLLPPAVVASENAAPPPPSPWVSYVTPSREHAKLGRFTGTWTADVSLWLGADQPPHRFTLKADTAMTLGGRFHETRLLGMIEGMVFEEVAVLGFDNATRKFTRTVANTFGTGLLVLQGEWAASEDAIDLRGEITHPATGATTRVRQRLTFLDLNTLLLENFDQVGEAPETKTMEQRLSRVTAGG